MRSSCASCAAASPVGAASTSLGGSRYEAWNLRRQRKRIYHRVLTLLKFWKSNGYEVLWITLTSSPNSDFDKIADHHRYLKLKLLERKLGFANVQHACVQTHEGCGTAHLFWAWKPTNGKRFYVPQKELSKLWDGIHDAKIVWVKKVRGNSHRKLTNYCVSQYTANQNQLKRMSWSWKVGLGGAMVKTWTVLKRVAHYSKHNYPYPDLYAMWGRLLAGGFCMMMGIWFIGTPNLGYIGKPPPPRSPYDSWW